MKIRHHISFCTLIALTACGGGSDATGPVTGLEGPQQVTIVESSGGSNSAVRLPKGVRAVVGSDYETDPTRMWVRDDSMTTLDTVNMILNSLSQTNYADQVNAGAYRCLVENDEEGGGERGQTGPNYEEWIVESTRASNSEPQSVKFWVQQDETMGQAQESIIYGLMTIAAEPSATQPLGDFELQFKCLPEAAAPTSTATSFQGYLRTVDRTDDQTEVEFFMWNGDPDGTVPSGEFYTRERVHVLGDPTTDDGRAYAEFKYVANNVPGMGGGGGSFTQQGEYQMQFNASYVALEDVTNGNTLDVKDRGNFDTYVFRYGLYDSTTEERVARMAGFPVEDVSGNYGWAGFHGIWFPEHVTVTNGMTVFRRSYSTGTLTPYTVVTVPGRLEKRTRSSITLGDIQDEDLETFDSTLGVEIRARFTGTDFVRTATRNNGQWQEETSPVSIASNYSSGQWMHLWNQARGSIEFSWPASLATTVPAYVWSSATINADSPELANGDLTLHGYFHMLRANITQNQADFANSETPYLPDATSVSSGNQTYVFDQTTLMLSLGGNPVNFATGVTANNGPGQFGFNCGPLFSTALTSFNEMETQTTTYEWMIGQNPWNQLRALKDDQGNYVTFDEPLRFTYTHSEQGSPHHGRTFMLEWTGMDLHGVPHEESGEDNRWYPLFNIPNGTTLTSGSSTYKIKQLEGEQIMVSVNSPSTVFAAQGFDLGTPVSAPDSTPWREPGIGAMPTITAAPLYVGGVAQTDN